MKRLLTPLAAACLLASATPLSAAPYSALYVFGDSLTDAGQFPDAGGPAGATARYTNRVGPTYRAGQGEVLGEVSPILLGRQLGLSGTGLGPSTSPVLAANGQPDGNNWAVGGYRTDQILQSITSVSATVAPPGTGTPLRQRPGYLPSVNGAADPNGLYYLTGGGNDFLQLRVTSTATAQAAAGRLVDGIEALQQAGARYIMVWLLPDVGLTPTFFGTGLQSLVSGLGADFNNELVRQLRTVDAQVIPLNVPLSLQELLNDPGTFGLATDQSLLGTCFDGCLSRNPVYGVNGLTPDPSKLIFNDVVHPTTALQEIIADYAYSLLAAPMELTLLPEMAHGSLRAHQDQLRGQWQADWEAWQAVGQWRGFVDGAGQRLDFDEQDNSVAGDGNGYSLNLGGSYRLDDAWRVGAALGFYEQGLDVGAADSDYDLRSYLATAFAQYQQNRWWADLGVSLGSLDYNNLERTLNLGIAQRSEKGDTDGDLWAVSGRVGYDIAQPGSEWHLSPFLSADYARVDVDGYAEDGVRSTAMTFDDQQRDSRRLGAGIQGRYQLNADTALFAEYAHEREYADDTTELRAELNSLPGIDFELQGYTPGDSLDRGTLGVSHKLAEDLSLRAGYSYRQADDETQHGINLSVALDW